GRPGGCKTGAGGQRPWPRPAGPRGRWRTRPGTTPCGGRWGSAWLPCRWWPAWRRSAWGKRRSGDGTSITRGPPAPVRKPSRAADAYENAFRDYGLDVAALPVEAAAERIRAQAVWKELVAALDNWARASQYTWGEADPRWQHLLAVARAADPDPWRNQLRDAW